MSLAIFAANSVSRAWSRLSLAAVNDADDTGHADAEHHLVAFEGLELLRDDAGRADPGGQPERASYPAASPHFFDLCHGQFAVHLLCLKADFGASFLQFSAK